MDTLNSRVSHCLEFESPLGHTDMWDLSHYGCVCKRLEPRSNRRVPASALAAALGARCERRDRPSSPRRLRAPGGASQGTSHRTSPKPRVTPCRRTRHCWRPRDWCWNGSTISPPLSTHPAQEVLCRSIDATCFAEGTACCLRHTPQGSHHRGRISGCRAGSRKPRAWTISPAPQNRPRTQ